jgi:hypothetical protein
MDDSRISLRVSKINMLGRLKTRCREETRAGK